jgi:hypothetical protein
MLPSPSMAVALLALAVALGGTTYAAVKVKKNSVGAKQLKTNAVTKPKLADGAVGTAELGGAAVTKAKIENGAVGTTELANNAVGSMNLQPNSVNASKVNDGTLTRNDLQRGVPVAGYARVIFTGGVPAVGAGAVNVNGTDDAGTGSTFVTFTDLAGGSIANCTVTATPLVPGVMAGSVLASAVVTQTAGYLSASTVQVTTRDAAAALADIDFSIQASCPPG